MKRASRVLLLERYCAFWMAVKLTLSSLMFGKNSGLGTTEAATIIGTESIRISLKEELKMFTVGELICKRENCLFSP